MNFHDFLCEKAMTNPLPTQFSSMNPILKRLNFPNKFYLELYVWISLPEKNALQEISTERPKPHIIFLNLKNAVSLLTGGLAKSVRSFSSVFFCCVCVCVNLCLGSTSPRYLFPTTNRTKWFLLLFFFCAPFFMFSSFILALVKYVRKYFSRPALC